MPPIVFLFMPELDYASLCVQACIQHQMQIKSFDGYKSNRIFIS